MLLIFDGVVTVIPEFVFFTYSVMSASLHRVYAWKSFDSSRRTPLSLEENVASGVLWYEAPCRHPTTHDDKHVMRSMTR